MVKVKGRAEFRVIRDYEKCNVCRLCEKLCVHGVHIYKNEISKMIAEEWKCVGCHFCEELCPVRAIYIEPNRSAIKDNLHWSTRDVYNVVMQSESGGVLLSSMGSDRLHRDYFSHIVLNAAQVTNPSIDPLREPVELKTFIGKKPARLHFAGGGSVFKPSVSLGPLLELETPHHICGHELWLYFP